MICLIGLKTKIVFYSYLNRIYFYVAKQRAMLAYDVHWKKHQQYLNYLTILDYMMIVQQYLVEELCSQQSIDRDKIKKNGTRKEKEK